MLHQYISFRNLRFQLFEVLEADKLNRFPYYSEYDKDAFEMTLDTAKQIADRDLFPYFMEMDRKKAYFDKESGTVKVSPQLKVIIQTLAEGGWIGAHAAAHHGGMQMPLVLTNAGLLTFYSANINAAYAFLTTGAANLILSFGSKTLQEAFVPNMYSGLWQGTMALTEPQAGSSLSDITTSALPTEKEGVYQIKGQKIYISGGDHTAVDNVVHLLLAKIKGSPVGAKGISLFVVPKHREENGELVSNDVTTAGIYGKMGQKHYVAAHLMFGEKDDCLGYLVGEPNKGLAYMFQMMNEARIATGMMAIASASAAYYASLKYAHERPQGRLPSNKDAAKPQIPIIEHPDVKRMLLFQKAVVEGAIALLMECSYLSDVAGQATGQEKADAHLLLELLTPIAKTFPAEMGTQSVMAGMQTLGGAGYCDDFPLEQIYRDIRINAIYEGTTGIHGLDLLGRKVSMAQGRALSLFLQASTQTIAEAGLTSKLLKKQATALDKSLMALHEITQIQLAKGLKEGPDSMLADATLYLEYFGIVAIAWQWLKQGIVAQKALTAGAVGEDIDFYNGKLTAMRFYFEYELPKTKPLHERLKSKDAITLGVLKEYIV